MKSAIWGEYKGTIPDVNHLDIINWVPSDRHTILGCCVITVVCADIDRRIG